MNRATIQLSIFFLALSALSLLLHGTFLLLQGPSLVFNQSYAYYYLTLNIILVTGQALMIVYFRWKGYRFLFISGIVATSVSIIAFAFQYFLMVTVARDLTIYFMPIAWLYLICAFVAGIAHIVPPAGRNMLLRILGIITIVNTALTMIVYLGAYIGLAEPTLSNLLIAANTMGIISPIGYIGVLVSDLRRVTEAPGSNIQENVRIGLMFFGIVGIAFWLVIGIQLGRETYWSVDWGKRGLEEKRKLASRFHKRVFVNSAGDTLQYLLMKPLSYDSTKMYPLVICLHGGPTRDPNGIEVTEPAPTLSEIENREKYPAFLFVPQGRPGVLWGGIPHIPSMQSLVFEAMDSLEKEFSIDADRRYVTGVSGGGYGTWHFICTHPDRFAAAMPMCGAGDPSLAGRIVHVPVWAFHGDVDRNVPVSGSRNMIEAIRKAGGTPRYSEFVGVGHNVWPEVIKTPGVLDWLFQQRRGSETK